MLILGFLTVLLAVLLTYYSTWDCVVWCGTVSKYYTQICPVSKYYLGSLC
jgi:hypothetical protein